MSQHTQNVSEQMMHSPLRKNRNYNVVARDIKRAKTLRPSIVEKRRSLFLEIAMLNEQKGCCLHLCIKIMFYNINLSQFPVDFSQRHFLLWRIFNSILTIRIIETT